MFEEMNGFTGTTIKSQSGYLLDGFGVAADLALLLVGGVGSARYTIRLNLERSVVEVTVTSFAM